MEENKKIKLSGSELVALSSSLAISISQKFDSCDLKKLKFFFQSLASNISIIESEGCKRKDKDSK